MNMLSTIVPKSDQINADDLIGKTMTITVREVKFSGGQEQPVSMYFDGSDKAFRPCKSMCRVLVAAWGPNAKEYVGRSMMLYRDPSVKWGGLEVGGIRISHMTHIDTAMTMALTATKGARKPFTVKPMALDSAKSNPDAAEKWASDHIGFVAGAIDLERLAAVQNSGKKAMDKLINSNPELHKLVVDAYAKRLDELSDANQGRTDTQHGEPTTLESAKDEIDACLSPAQVEERRAALVPLLGDEDAAALDRYAADYIAGM